MKITTCETEIKVKSSSHHTHLCQFILHFVEKIRWNIMWHRQWSGGSRVNPQFGLKAKDNWTWTKNWLIFRFKACMWILDAKMRSEGKFRTFQIFNQNRNYILRVFHADLLLAIPRYDGSGDFFLGQVLKISINFEYFLLFSY